MAFLGKICWENDLLVNNDNFNTKNNKKASKKVNFCISQNQEKKLKTKNN